ncbi:M24 family metallopeptidase [Lacticigenium naphthae]|uniref:M24 family metallopeptidase n=1 Tax=Lacticigenium naphthae TaxID=515351 RepID=UPI00040D1617|nr:Xaa-Pro peptidase family protein [Lacticigenium naphthae]
MSRVKKIQEKLVERKLDAILVTSPYNLRYVSNFTGTTGLSVITKDTAYFVTDFRYTEQAGEQAKNFSIIENKGDILAEVANICEKESIEKLGFEEKHVTVSTYDNLEDLVDSELISASGLIEDFREIKEPKEIELIKRAIEITEAAYEYILDFIKPGMTEIEIANELDFYMRKQGATGVSFDTIVASGVRSAMPHGVASEKRVQKGEMITIDFGCYYKGYVSDMTRTFALGDPGEELKKIYAIVRKAQLKVLEAAKPGMTGAELDAVSRGYISEEGYGEHFGHSTGHGIGLEVHEGPAVSSKSDKKFVPGNVITDEPGIYIPGLGGVRIEDDLLITESGNQNLMTLSKELIIL